LYGLLVRARRLSDCWASAGQLMSSRYADRVMISDFIYFISKIGHSPSFIIFIFIHVLSFNPPILHIQSQVLSRLYPTNIITVFFLFYGSPRSYFPNPLSRHATIYYHAVFPFVLLSGYSHKTIARKRASSEYFWVCMCVWSYTPSILSPDTISTAALSAWVSETTPSCSSSAHSAMNVAVSDTNPS